MCSVLISILNMTLHVQGDVQHRDKGDSSTLSDQLTTVLEELKHMKAEKERENDSSRRINRGRSGSGERSSGFVEIAIREKPGKGAGNS